MGSSSMRNYLDPVMHWWKLQRGNVSSFTLAVIFLHQAMLRNQKIPLPISTATPERTRYRAQERARSVTTTISTKTAR